MTSRLMGSAIITLGLLLAACGTTTSAPATATPAAPATVAPASPTALASPATAPATAPAKAAAGTPVAATVAKPAGGTTRVVLGEGTVARFLVKEQLANQSLPNDAVGTTQEVDGTIVLGPDGKIVADQSKIAVNLQTLETDEDRRDNYIKRTTLQTATYPNAEFVPTEARGLPWPLPTSGEATFDLIGDLTLHGVTRPTTWQTTVTFNDQAITGTAKTAVKITDFGMEIPRVAMVLSIEDEARLEIDVKAQRQ